MEIPSYPNRHIFVGMVKTGVYGFIFRYSDPSPFLTVSSYTQYFLISFLLTSIHFFSHPLTSHLYSRFTYLFDYPVIIFPSEHVLTYSFSFFQLNSLPLKYSIHLFLILSNLGTPNIYLCIPIPATFIFISYLTFDIHIYRYIIAE